MNRLFIVLSLILAPALLHAEKLEYMAIQDVASANRIAVTDMADFMKIIKDHKVKNVFFSKDQFVLQIESVLYTIGSAGFTTIEDYLAGKETFGDGDAFYTAKKNALKTRAEVDYFRNEDFLSGEDYAAALKAGFVNNSVKPKPKAVTGLLTTAELRKNIYFVDALFSILLYKESEQNEKQGILKNTDIAFLVNLGGGSIKPLDKDLYYLNIRTDRKKATLAEEINRFFDRKGRNNKDAVLYYMASLSQFKTAEEYQAAITAGDATIRGTKERYLAAGFKTLEQVEKAIAAGFASGGEYSLATDYQLKNNAEYAAAKTRIEGYEKLKKTYGLRTRIEAFVVERMLALPAGVPISLERFAEQYNAAIAEDQLLSKASYKIDAKFLDGLFNMTPSLGGLFVYDVAGASLQKK
jgi:hypothetical protein